MMLNGRRAGDLIVISLALETDVDYRVTYWPDPLRPKPEVRNERDEVTFS